MSPGGRKSRGRWCAPSWGCRVNMLAGLGTVHLPVWLVFGTGQVLGSLAAHEIHLGPGFQRGVWGGLCTLGGLLPSHCASLLLCGLSHLTVHRESPAVPPLGSLFSAFCQQSFLPPGNCTWASCSRMRVSSSDSQDDVVTPHCQNEWPRCTCSHAVLGSHFICFFS